jgi:capsular polysaccharide biosynthesis protein
MTGPDYAAEAAGYEDDDLDEADIVEWYEARPVTVSTAVATGSIVAAFALGVVAAAGAVLLARYLDED